MRKILVAAVSLLILSSCGINKQTKELKVLGDCKYDLQSIDSLYIAGTPLKKIVNNNNIDISSAPAIAMGFLRKNIPLEGRVNLKIDNPTSKKAAINQFEYIVLLQKKELASGFVNQKVSVDAGQTVNVPVSLKTNIYDLVSGGNFEEILSLFNSERGNEEGLVTIKVKPILLIGNTQVKYPGYITIDKKISRSILL
ncbi:hypothetical protein [Pseudopedobacter beijingensis]|uniref:Late embryogenesis abundant protein n=1 Tax=Pseudopedobacter beijingensis TaxID=1207056 RepID=A0ABW4IEY8_9SPHI